MFVVFHGLEHERCGGFDAAQQLDDDVYLRVGKDLIRILSEFPDRDIDASVTLRITFQDLYDIDLGVERAFDYFSVHFKRFICTGADVSQPQQPYFYCFHFSLR